MWPPVQYTPGCAGGDVRVLFANPNPHPHPHPNQATLLVGGVLALHRRRRVTVYLTCVGGGAFGNDEERILDP